MKHIETALVILIFSGAASVLQGDMSGYQAWENKSRVSVLNVTRENSPHVAVHCIAKHVRRFERTAGIGGAFDVFIFQLVYWYATSAASACRPHEDAFKFVSFVGELLPRPVKPGGCAWSSELRESLYSPFYLGKLTFISVSVLLYISTHPCCLLRMHFSSASTPNPFRTWGLSFASPLRSHLYFFS